MTRYEVEGVVGRGAMGVVYRARQTEPPQRLVAYKRVSGRDPVLDERLRREAEVLASLDHPNIIRIYDVVDDETGMAIVLQYAGGGSLADRLERRGALAPADTATVLVAVADALDAAHRRGILHRDIKPGNILFTADGHPLLSDFGVARREGDAPLTQAGALGPATADYLDPAVADGAPFDFRSDIYALGVVGYEMLTGQRPYTADSPLAVLRAADQAAVQPLREVMPDVPPDIAAAVGAAMARDPGLRPASAGDFAALLRAAVTAQALRLQPTTRTTAPTVAAAVPHAATPEGAPAPRHEPPTRIFGARPPQPCKAPANASVPWWRIAAVAVALAVIPSLVVLGSGTPPRRPPPAAPPAAAPAAPAVLAPPPLLHLCRGTTVPPARNGWIVAIGDLEGIGCRSWVRSRSGILHVALSGAKPLRLRLGRRGDQVLLGDWDCNGTVTAALYARATGDLHEFDRWPEPGGTLRSTTTRATGIIGGTASVSVSDSGCDGVVVARSFDA